MTATTLTGNVQSSLAAWNDKAGAWQALQAAYAGLGEQVYGLVMDQGSPDDPANYTAGWSTLLDPDQAPAWALPYTALFVGAVVPPGTDEATARALIKSETGQQRGTAAAIVSAGKRFLIGNQTCTLYERTSASGASDPYHFVLSVLASEAQPTNLVVNPSFEYDTVGAAPYGWTTSTGGTATISLFQATNGWAASGVQSARISGTGVTTGSAVYAISSAITVTAGTTYAAQATFDVLTSGTSPALTMQFYDVSNTPLAHPGVGGMVAKGTQTLNVPAAAAPANAVSCKVELALENTAVATGSVDGYLDAVCFQPVAPGAAASFGDGDQIGWQWTGTPGQSTSQRNIQPLIDAVNSVKPAGLQWTLDQVAVWTLAGLEGAYASISAMESAFHTIAGVENDQGGM